MIWGYPHFRKPPYRKEAETSVQDVLPGVLPRCTRSAAASMMHGSWAPKRTLRRPRLLVVAMWEVKAEEPQDIPRLGLWWLPGYPLSSNVAGRSPHVEIPKVRFWSFQATWALRRLQNLAICPPGRIWSLPGHTKRWVFWDLLDAAGLFSALTLPVFRVRWVFWRWEREQHLNCSSKNFQVEPIAPCSATIPCFPPFQNAEGRNAGAEEFGDSEISKEVLQYWKHQLISQHPRLLESQLLQFLLQKLKA